MAFTPYIQEPVTDAASLAGVRRFRQHLDGRRSVRQFDTRPVPKEVIEEILMAAGTAPSGAHKQPWTFVAIADQALKAQIREACEAQEKRFYEELAPQEWLDDLAPLGTDFEKSHITDAPWVVVLFAQKYDLRPDGSKGKHYYVQESVGIAAGFFLAAVREAGLCCLTHTPSPMGFLKEILGRPDNEEAFLLLPVGHAADDATVPDLARKPLDAFTVWKE